MKKNFLTAIAVMVTAFLVGTTIAQAADVTFGGQLRPRFEVNDQSDFNDNTDQNYFVASRIRLNANVNVNESTSAFIQMQSVRIWGDAIGTSTTSTGAGNASFTVSDGDATVGLHQAYFTLKNFASLPVDLKVGRQEVVLDGHRLFGNTGWTTGAQTHDAVRATHKHGNHSLDYAYILASESGTTKTEKDDVDAHLVHANFQGILGGNLSVTYAALIDGWWLGAGTGAACLNLDNDIHTIGFRQAGQLFGIDYRGEYYYQFGDAAADGAASGIRGLAGIAPGTGVITRNTSAGKDIDRDAYMFGVRVGKTFQNVMMKPSLTIWYDYLSGTSDSDAAAGEYGTFNTLFDTGHKFYGYMDLFLPATGSASARLGLQDLAIKAKIQPMDKWTVKADYHWFYTAEGAAGNPVVSAGDGSLGGSPGANTAGAGFASSGIDGSDLGQELDITVVHKYNANTKIVLGYSSFFQSSLFHDINNNGGDGADWGYVMFDVTF